MYFIVELLEPEPSAVDVDAHVAEGLGSVIGQGGAGGTVGVDGDAGGEPRDVGELEQLLGS